MNANLSDRNTTLNQERLLKPNEVADLLNISRSYAYRLLQTGAIPVIRMGNACRVQPIDLTEYLKENLHRKAQPS
jgi:excisionase family DNA binding protein